MKKLYSLQDHDVPLCQSSLGHNHFACSAPCPLPFASGRVVTGRPHRFVGGVRVHEGSPSCHWWSVSSRFVVHIKPVCITSSTCSPLASYNSYNKLAGLLNVASWAYLTYLTTRGRRTMKLWAKLNTKKRIRLKWAVFFYVEVIFFWLITTTRRRKRKKHFRQDDIHFRVRISFRIKASSAPWGFYCAINNKLNARLHGPSITYCIILKWCVSKWWVLFIVFCIVFFFINKDYKQCHYTYQ